MKLTHQELTHLASAASRQQAVMLAQEIAQRFSAYYGVVPSTYLALGVRELMRFCEDANIWEPADIAVIIRAMFTPAPNCLSENDRNYAIRIISNTQAAPEARARSVSQALTGTAPPPRDPSGLR